jgi:hypothetical protein
MTVCEEIMLMLSQNFLPSSLYTQRLREFYSIYTNRIFAKINTVCFYFTVRGINPFGTSL